VYGGAGGVGVFVVQFAAILGAHVTATGRGEDAAFVRSLGAETFIPAGDQTDGAFDIVIDTRGRPGPRRLLPAAGPGWQARHA